MSGINCLRMYNNNNVALSNFKRNLDQRLTFNRGLKLDSHLSATEYSNYAFIALDLACQVQVQVQVLPRQMPKVHRSVDTRAYNYLMQCS